MCMCVCVCTNIISVIVKQLYQKSKQEKTTHSRGTAY